LTNVVPARAEGTVVHLSGDPSMSPSWIRKLFTRPVTHPIRKRHRPRRALEQLEERALLSVIVSQNFPDINFNQTAAAATPPDTMMAVGPTTVLGAVNTALVLKNKTGGTLAGPTEFSTFFSSIVRPGDLFSDPYVLYDDQAGRYYVGIIEFPSSTSTGYFDFAVSNSNTPTGLTVGTGAGNWTVFPQITSVSEGGAQFPDFPKMGWNNDAVFVSFNEFAGGATFSHNLILAISKTSILAGGPLSTFTTDVSTQDETRILIPARMHNEATGNLEYFVQKDSEATGTVNVVAETGYLTASPSFVTTTIQVAPYANSPGVPGLTTQIDDRILSADWANNKLVAAQDVGVGGLNLARWYEFDTSATPALVPGQEGNISPAAGVSTSFPSIAINATGDIGITYVQSSSTQPFSMYVTGRLASDTPGILQTAVEVAAGAAPVPSALRGGDYSATEFDPSNPSTFWSANEFMLDSSGSNFDWGTQIASYSFTPAAKLTSITVTPTNPSIGEGLTEQFTATGTYSDGSTQDITRFVAWASATPAVATIDASGLATTYGVVGTSVITASLSGITSQNDTLTTLPLISLALTPTSPSVPVFSTVQFIATGTYSDGSTHALPGSLLTWVSATPAVATIGATGLATAKGVGTSSITAAAFGVTSPGDVLTVTPPSFVVNTTQDEINSSDGMTSLREAIMAANASPTNTTIGFDPTVFATLQTITLTLGELELTNTTATEAIVGPTARVKVSGGSASRVFQVDAGVTAALANMTITGGKTSADGGGLYNLGTATLTSCTITGNSATNGGGIMNNGGTATLTGCTISGNSAAGGAYYGLYNNGGGLDNALGLATLTNCTVSGNSSSAYGGGISSDSGTTVLKNCTVSGNSGVYGGGVNVGPLGSATLTNSTLSGNSGRYGAGLFIGANILYGPASYGTATLTNCTVSGNTGFAGGGVYNQGGLNIGNTIVARNSASYSGPDFFDALGSISSAGHNLIGATNDSTGWTSSDLTGTAAAPLNPLLAALGNYGGPTKTMALLPGSPAIDAGTSTGAPATDQRGKGRVGPVDIGAFESQGFTLTPVAGSTPQSAGFGKAFTNALAVTVKAKNAIEPVNGGVINFVAHPASNGASATLSAASAVISGGTASVKATANKIAGSYTVSASARGVATAAQFALSNHAGAIRATAVQGTTGTGSLFTAADLGGPSHAGIAADDPLAGAPIAVGLAASGEQPPADNASNAPFTSPFEVGLHSPPLSKGGLGGSGDGVSGAPLGNVNIFFDIASGRFMRLEG
jgi:CSLREA domain-containing protein